MNEDTRAAERLAELPEETRQFLAELEPEDITTLREGLQLIRSMLTVGRFSRRVIVLLVGAIIGGVMLADNLAKVWGWWHPKP